MAASRQQAPTVQCARAIADRVVASFPSIDAILLCGSVARGDADPWSDIDLVVIGCDIQLTTEVLQKLVADRHEAVSIIYYTTPEFEMRLREGALFMAHLMKEGVPLFDRIGIHQALANLSLSSGDIVEQIRLETAKLDVYLDPRRFNNNYLFCLSHLYSIGKGVVMLSLAKRGVLEFNRDAAFQRFMALNPDLASETQKVAQLRAFYRIIAGRPPESLPFSYRSADREMHEVICAIQTLAKRAEQG